MPIAIHAFRAAGTRGVMGVGGTEGGCFYRKQKSFQAFPGLPGGELNRAIFQRQSK